MSVLEFKAGTKIGIIATASPCAPEVLSKGKAFLESHGFQTTIALNPSKDYGRHKFLFSSDSAAERARGLEDLFSDPGVGLILAARGGYGSSEMLPYLDFDLIKKHPTPFCGFSDASAISLALYAKERIPSIHGLTLSTFSSESEMEAGESFEALKSLLSVKKAGSAPSSPLLKDLRRISGTKDSQGTLIGGNLSTVLSLLGTPYFPQDLENHIFFFEEIGEAPHKIHRKLLQLKLAGFLDRLSGVVVGRLSNCEHSKGLGPDTKAVLQDIFRDFPYPLVQSASFGHQGRILPLPM